MLCNQQTKKDLQYLEKKYHLHFVPISEQIIVYRHIISITIDDTNFHAM